MEALFSPPVAKLVQMKVLAHLFWAAVATAAAFCLAGIALNRGEHINSI